MEMADITNGIMMASQAGIMRAHQRHAERADARAHDARLASQVLGAASQAHADVASRLRTMLLASDLEIERLQDKVDTLADERAQLMQHCLTLLDEVEVLRGRAH